MDHDPGDPTTTGADAPQSLEARVAAIERSMGELDGEVRTRRLVVVDADGTERIVASAGESFAEVRLSIGDRRRRLDVAVFAAREPPGADGSSIGGLEVWLDGDHLGGLTLTADR